MNNVASYHSNEYLWQKYLKSRGWNIKDIQILIDLAMIDVVGFVKAIDNPEFVKSIREYKKI